jgi:hypothetical protein
MKRATVRPLALLLLLFSPATARHPFAALLARVERTMPASVSRGREERERIPACARHDRRWRTRFPDRVGGPATGARSDPAPVG